MSELLSPKSDFPPPNALASSAVAATTPTTQRADSVSSSSVNGKGINPPPPAVPSLGGPTIINGNNAVGPASPQHLREHIRKPSVTISAAGTSGQMPNGGPVAGKSAAGNGIQFGSMNSNASTSPGVIHSTPTAPAAGPAQASSLSTPANPRITSPQNSPSPIPQPPASGGRPPSSLHSHGNGGLSFGSLGGDEVAQLRRGSMPVALTPNMQNAHLRRESTPTTHNEMNGMGYNSGRGGYPHQGGRGRGYPHQQYGQQMPYSPNNSFRAPNAPRGSQGMPSPFAQQRGMAQGYPQPPHQMSRSPSMAAAQPIHPAAGQMPMQNSQMPQQPFYAPGMPQQSQFMGPYDPNYAAFYGAPYAMQPGMPMPPHFVPQSPRPSFSGQPPQPYMPNQYNPHQPASMSRTSSNVSDRPQSTVGQAPPNMPPGTGHQASVSRSTNSPAPKSSNNFQIPTRKPGGIIIKDPESGAVKTFEKAAPSPVPSKSPSNSNAAPTPPPAPKTPGQPDPVHARAESASVKSSSEKGLEMVAAVRQKIEEDKRKEQQENEQKAAAEKEEVETPQDVAEAKPAEGPTTSEDKVASLADGVGKLSVADVAKPASTETTKSADDTKVPPEEDEDSEEYWARIEAEEAAKEAEREAAYQKRQVAQREEKAKREAEEAARMDEEMKRAEREAEEAEEARLKKMAERESNEEPKDDLFASLKRSENAFQVTKTATETPPGLDTPAESGTATPVSQSSSSMGPPPPRSTGAKPKPPSLKLESTKPVEPSQPSAALQSLRSARFLTSISDATYPAAIASPNPALNSAAPSGKFRYDKDFLLQFQKVFTEKPSEAWNERVKETVGDTSETPTSTRGPRNPGANLVNRTGSQRGGMTSAMGFNNSGAFGQFTPAGRPAAPGGPGDARFGSNKGQQMRIPNAVGSFPMGFPTPNMVRTSSSTSLGQQSPRHNTSHRGDRGGSRRGGSKRDSEKDAKMPMTANMDIKPITVSETGWKPLSISQNSNLAGPPPGGDTYLAPDVVQRKVKASLNKMTPSTFDKISDQILSIVQQSQKETDGRTLRQVIGLTFEKATDEAHWAAMYANFCSKMLAFVQAQQPEIKDETLPLDKNGKVNAGGTLFRKYLLNRCQQDFEAGWQSKIPAAPDGDDKSKEAEMLSDEYYAAAAAKRRGLGLVRFIGELYKLGMLTSRIMHMCVKKLVDFDGMPDEAEVESLTSLLKTVGGNLDSEDKARPSMDAYFGRINDMINLDGLPSRMKFMLMDIVDLRKSGWKTKDSAKGPATIEEIHAQAAAADREREAQRAADNSRNRGGGGGGRIGLGKGDARQFSGGAMPPQQSNTVDPSDLRRLGRNASRQSGMQGPMSLGPTSMFGSRGSNPRRTLGASTLGRLGDDSSASSRTGTPPINKDKKDEQSSTSANTFSALAGLGDSGEKDDHTSSPLSRSPPVANARPVSERQRSKSPLKGEEKV